MWTDDGRTTEASHTKSSPGAFGSGELKIKVYSAAIFFGTLRVNKALPKSLINNAAMILIALVQG